ncbi:hypothetical protein [Vibrio alfacsensis]|uniref:hypothetical protein n=1 Tax=Vibrio alfacsensis TaxID=1074311 RepID=UPI00406940C9
MEAELGFFLLLLVAVCTSCVAVFHWGGGGDGLLTVFGAIMTIAGKRKKVTHAIEKYV